MQSTQLPYGKDYSSKAQRRHPASPDHPEFRCPESKALPFIISPHSPAGASGFLQVDVTKLVRAVSRNFGGFTSGAFHQHVLLQAWPA